jgi:hypothetical protein
VLQAFEELLFHVNINELMWSHPGLQGMTNSGYPNVASFRRTCKNRLLAANVPPNLRAGWAGLRQRCGELGQILHMHRGTL